MNAGGYALQPACILVIKVWMLSTDEIFSDQ